MQTNCAWCNTKLTVQPEDQCANCGHANGDHVEANLEWPCMPLGIICTKCDGFEPLPTWCDEVCQHRYNNDLAADMRGDKVE